MGTRTRASTSCSLTVLRRVGVVLVALVALQIGGGIVMADELKVGDAAPDFSLPGSDGRTHTLAEHRGKRVVVLAWFPKAFTGG